MFETNASKILRHFSSPLVAPDILYNLYIAHGGVVCSFRSLRPRISILRGSPTKSAFAFEFIRLANFSDTPSLEMFNPPSVTADGPPARAHSKLPRRKFFGKETTAGYELFGRVVRRRSTLTTPTVAREIEKSVS